MNARKIPVARDTHTNALVLPSQSLSGESTGRYRCLDANCRSNLHRVDRGPTAYFRHNRGSARATCRFYSPDSLTRHTLATQVLEQVMNAALLHEIPMPMLRFETQFGPRDVLPFLLGDAVRGDRQWRSSETGRLPDVTILYNGDPVLLIEVHHRNRVRGLRSRDLDRYWWIEVEADDVLADPQLLVVKGRGNLPASLARYAEQFTLFPYDDVPLDLIRGQPLSLSACPATV